jgi:TMEM175 potassium channel family protein
VIIGSYWYEHWRFFRYIKHSTTSLVVRNLLFLASLVLLPFLSHLYGGNFYLSGERNSLNYYLVITTLLFYTFLLVTGLLLWFVWRYASRKHRLIDEGLTPPVIRNTTIRLFRVPLAIIVYLVAFVVFSDSIAASVVPVIVFLVIWEGMRRFLLRRAPALKPTDTRRLVIFSDCVMAIAITLVAAQLELPELKLPVLTVGTDSNITITGPAVTAVGHFSLTLFIYLVAFLNIGIHWMSHYHMFRSIKRSNAWLAVLNFAFLLCITLLFLPTSASIQYDSVFASRFYYIAQTITALLLVLMWAYAVQKHRLLDEAADPTRIRRTMGRLVRNLLIFAALAVLTLVLSIQIDILAYFWIYLLVEFVAYAIRRVQHRIQRRKPALAEKGNKGSPKK